MRDLPLSPLRFERIYKPALWGGRRLADLFGWALPGDGPIGEAWVLSDQGDQSSRVVEGPLQGLSLREVMEAAADRVLGASGAASRRFPLLLKFLDAQLPLSVQVHPDDRHTDLLPPGERGKTEAWVVLHAEPDSRIYAGLKPGTGPDELRRALAEGTVADCLHAFTPCPGDCVFIPAGTVHALGAGVALFEIQQTSDVTFRLYDWDRTDPRTGRPRELHIAPSLACIDYASGPRSPVAPAGELLVSCSHFQMWRRQGRLPFRVGAPGACRVLVAIEGRADLVCGDASYPLHKGDVLLLPAAVGAGLCRPAGAVTLLECGPCNVEPAAHNEG